LIALGEQEGFWNRSQPRCRRVDGRIPGRDGRRWPLGIRSRRHCPRRGPSPTGEL